MWLYLKGIKKYYKIKVYLINNTLAFPLLINYIKLYYIRISLKGEIISYKNAFLRK